MTRQVPGYGGSGAYRVPREMANRVWSHEMRALRSQVRDEEGTTLQPIPQRCGVVPHGYRYATGETGSSLYPLSFQFSLRVELRVYYESVYVDVIDDHDHLPPC